MTFGFWVISIFLAGFLAGTTVLSLAVGKFNDAPELRSLRSQLQAGAVMAAIANLGLGLYFGVIG